VETGDKRNPTAVQITRRAATQVYPTRG